MGTVCVPAVRPPVPLSPSGPTPVSTPGRSPASPVGVLGPPAPPLSAAASVPTVWRFALAALVLEMEPGVLVTVVVLPLLVSTLVPGVLVPGL